MAINKILVPIDSIEWDNTLNAVDTAIRFQEGCKVEGKDMELIFMHVLQVKGKFSASERKRILDLKRKEMEDEFYMIEEMCGERGLENFRTIIKEGEPDEEIVKAAQDEGVDLIVMGSGKLHDRSAKGRFQKFMYGSVTEKVLHEAPCSVLVARPLR